MKKQVWAALGLAVVLAVVTVGPAGASVASQGKNEGKVSILAWPGYAENGSTDSAYDWVTPFEDKTGCKASVKTFSTSDEAFQLFQTGQYDVGSFSGDSALRSIVNGDAAPINLKKVSTYADLAEFMKDQAWNSYKGKTYGVPHGWGGNLLMWNVDDVTPTPTSGASCSTRTRRTAGRSRHPTTRSTSRTPRSTCRRLNPTSGSRTPTRWTRSSSTPR